MPISKCAFSPPSSHDNNRLAKHVRKTSKNGSNGIKKGKKHDRKHHVDNEDGLDSDSLTESESDSELDVEGGIPLKDIKGAGCTITHCCNMFYDVNKAVHVVILSKQEDQREDNSEDKDWCQARKEALKHM
ncbi:hypothetical protein J3R82DRAFT_2730 [Butyriboletus roseoflavus]|nr:hypothetical protein J3R82DRAFT_2730 [Butyriboletus roseoflavus]